MTHTANAYICTDGLVDIPTSDGPEPSACLGCLACRPVDIADEIIASHARANAVFALIAAERGDEDPF